MVVPFLLDVVQIIKGVATSSWEWGLAIEVLGSNLFGNILLLALTDGLRV